MDSHIYAHRARNHSYANTSPGHVILHGLFIGFSLYVSEMRVSVTSLGLLLTRLVAAYAMLLNRAPPTFKLSPSADPIAAMVRSGIHTWSPLSGLQSPKKNHAPIPEMPFGLGLKDSRRKSPARDKHLYGTPGHPMGPYKSPKAIRKLCELKRALCRSGGVRMTLRGTGNFKLGVVIAVAPFARQGWESITQSNTRFGKAARAFDDWVAGIQEAIGGPLQPDIYGNALKKRIIKAMGKALQLGFETVNQKWEREADERRAAEVKMMEMTAEVNELLQACEETEDRSAVEAYVIETFCTQLYDQVAEAEATV